MRTFGLLTSLLWSSLSIADREYNPATVIQWTPKQFSNETQYSLIYDNTLRKNVIRAESNGSASGLFYEEKIDLDKTPWLSWSWRIEKFPAVDDEKTKAGDDFAARIYIVINDGWTILGTKAISYVWSQQSQINDTWPNPFAGKRAMMLTIENTTNGEWITEKRNLKDDLKKLFGRDFDSIDAIAIMTDTDNSDSSAISYYGNIMLSEK